MATLTALLPRESPPRMRFTRAEYERMIDAGVFDDRRCELIDGELIDKTGQKPPHAACVAALNDLLVELFGRRRIRTQLPLEMSARDAELNLPEPDLIVLAGRFTDRNRHPRGDETICVIEIADSSLAFDQKVKSALYARASVPEYWIVDVKAREISIHRKPDAGRYSDITTAGETDTVVIGDNPTTAVAIGDIFS